MRSEPAHLYQNGASTNLAASSQRPARTRVRDGRSTSGHPRKDCFRTCVRLGHDQLVNFGTVNFTQCVAISAHDPNAVRESYHYPDISRRLHMYDRRNDSPPRIVALSKPNLPGTGPREALTVNYVGP